MFLWMVLADKLEQHMLWVTMDGNAPIIALAMSVGRSVCQLDDDPQRMNPTDFDDLTYSLTRRLTCLALNKTPPLLD